MSRLESQHQRGYNLIVLSVLVMVLIAVLAMALPSIKVQDQREREDEAIFRGLQYAEAIRVFQQRQGRLPNSLDELLRTEPRSIRQLWTDPLTDDGEWGLVRGSAQVQPGGDDEGDDEGDEEQPPGRSTESRFGGSGLGQRDDAETLGPISGVFTRAEGVPIKSFFGSETYKEWIFTPQFLPTPVVSPDGNYVTRPTAEWVGRAFRDGLVAPGVQGLPGGQELGGGSAPKSRGLDLSGDDDEGDDG
ncbi:MAG: hypothetical protein R2991_14980 [Thermoanaerobaculia bacterium]